MTELGNQQNAKSGSWMLWSLKRKLMCVN